MIDFRHFEFGVQPQDRAALHEQLLADPAWTDKSHNDLEAELGESIVGALGSLTMLMMRKPQARLGGGTIAFESDESQAASSTSNMVIATASSMELHGLDLTELKEVRERADNAVENMPMRFDILGSEIDSNGEPVSMATVWFDGTHYGISRTGNRFDYTDRGRVFPTFVRDGWRIWDYNSTKIAQRTAERDDIVYGTQRLIAGVESGRDTEQISRVLCTAGLLFSERFIYSDRYKIADASGRQPEDVTYAEILTRKALGEYFEGSRLRHFDILDDMTVTITDDSQLALLRFWFATEGVRQAYGDFKEEESVTRDRLQRLLAERIENTAGASNWDAARMRTHLLSVLDHEAESFTAAYQKNFSGHSFAQPTSSTHILTDAEYPELNGNKRHTDLSTAIAMAQNPPTHRLLEQVRELQRIEDDLNRVDIDDEARIDALELEIDQLSDRIHEEAPLYETVLNAAAEGARVGIHETLGFRDYADLRAMTIEGILLAKEIARRADEA